jgi:hypothetical protein
MVAALTGSVASWSASAVAPDATLSIDPPTLTVNAGNTFTVNVNQNVPTAATAGAQTDVLFDQTQLQITGVTKGPAYTGSAFYIGVVPQTLAQAIAEANTTGRLRNMAASFNPGAGSVAPGANTAFILTMSAQAGASGSSDVTLDRAEVLDANFGSLTVAIVKGTVVVNNPNVPTNTPTVTPTPSPAVTPGGPTSTSTNSPTNTPTNSPTNSPTRTSTNTPTNTPTPTKTPTGTPTGTLTPATATAVPTNTPALTDTPTATPFAGKGSVYVVPESVDVSPNTDFTVNINQTADFSTTGTQTNIDFDPNLLQVLGVDRAPAFAKPGASFVAGVVKLDASGNVAGQQTIAEAIAEANQTGTLRNVAANYPPPAYIPNGENSFLIVKMKSSGTEGTSKITLDHAPTADPGYPGPEMLDLDGNNVKVTATNGQVNVKVGAPPPPTPVVAVAAAASPVSASGTPRAAISTSSGTTGSTSTTLGSSRPGTVLGSSASPTGLPRTGEGANPGGRMLVLALVAALSTLGFGGLAFAGYARQRRGL